MKTEAKVINMREHDLNLLSGNMPRITFKMERTSTPDHAITGARDVYRAMLDAATQLDIESKEYFYCMYLTRANKVIAISQISEGGTSGTVADGKIIFKEALLLGASAIILSHNHPSGNPKPSASDISLTKKISEFARLINMEILDHVIFTPYGKYYSFADEGNI